MINFSKSFSDYANPGFVHVNDSSMIMAMTVPHDIVMADHLIEAQIPIVSLSLFAVCPLLCSAPGGTQLHAAMFAESALKPPYVLPLRKTSSTVLRWKGFT